jgi:preprotein translocase subunit SecG
MKKHSEGLKCTRLLMVLSSFSPLFILWAIRGNSVLPNDLFIGLCVALIFFPNIFLLARIKKAKTNKDAREIVVGSANDHRDHILVYLFAILLPFYSEDINSIRNLISTFTAIVFIVFIFWYLNLHYINFFFVLLGYRIFTVNPPRSDNPLTGNMCVVVITRRINLFSGDKLNGYRLSNTVYMEAGN